MKTHEELKHDLFNLSSEAENALTKLEKANLILDRWIYDYSFSENPDPIEAIKYRNSNPRERNLHQEQSCKWLYEYNEIHGLVSIVHDYVSECKGILEKAVYSKPLEKSA